MLFWQHCSSKTPLIGRSENTLPFNAVLYAVAMYEFAIVKVLVVVTPGLTRGLFLLCSWIYDKLQCQVIIFQRLEKDAGSSPA